MASPGLSQTHWRASPQTAFFVEGLTAGSQALAQQVVHRTLERVAGAPNLFPHLGGNIIVDGKSGSHIMMLINQAS
jgi:hypothetical protein